MTSHSQQPQHGSHSGPGCPQGQAHSQPYFNAQHRPRPNAGRRGADPLTYNHRYPSLRRFAEFLALRYPLERTRHAYYRQLRLLADHVQVDPGTLDESQVRDFLLD